MLVAWLLAPQGLLLAKATMLGLDLIT